ncbi:hypothetical protein [Alkalilimnicola ehrlichii]|uniref:hypothetical protein n=1 Tax=Alkalilimnicola ehrlichii TaxID=351052 RepID=UPI0011C04CAA|nr:hypothetical protein [Alkalilimnicola ehrlichii]
MLMLTGIKQSGGLFLLIALTMVIAMLLVACSTTNFSAKRMLSRVVADDFDGALSRVKVERELELGGLQGSGRLRVWLYDEAVEQYLFFYLHAAEYQEPAYRENRRTHARHTEADVQAIIAAQRADIQARVAHLQAVRAQLDDIVEYPVFVFTVVAIRIVIRRSAHRRMMTIIR